MIEDDEFHLSKLAYGFIAGQLEHARALSAVVAPTVNSYKRLVPGYEAPVYVGWAQINRSALIRIPRYTQGAEQGHARLSCASRIPPPTLTWLLPSCWQLPWMESTNTCPLPEPLNNVNVYHLTAEERQTMNIQELPGSLSEALRELDQDIVLQNALGPVMYEAFVRAKKAEIEKSRMIVSDWEVGRYLEMA